MESPSTETWEDDAPPMLPEGKFTAEDENEEAVASEEDPSVESDDDAPLVSKRKHHRSKSQRKMRKSDRRRDLASFFIDNEAAESDEDEEIYDDSRSVSSNDVDESKRYKSFYKEKNQEDRPHRPVSGAGHFATTVQKLAERFEDETESGLMEVIEGEESDDPELANLLPDMNDPKLWLVKLNKTGKERELVISIQNKFFKLQDQGIDLGITSCYAAQSLKGYIYVESISQSKVKEALRGLRNVNFKADIKMVSLKEMPSVFAMAEPDRYIPQAFDYVRVKRGLYGGDLGQIVSIEDHGASLTVKLIPRVDLALLIEMDKNGKRHTYDKEVLTKGGERPMKKLLDRDEVDTKGYQVEQGQPQKTIRLAGSIFDEAGYIYKQFSLNRLFTGGDVNPGISELKEFDSSKTRILRPTKQQLQLYRTGERVKIISGDLLDIHCKILQIEEDVLEVQPEGHYLQTFKVPLSQVSKVFSVGDCVKAISGINMGDSGMITFIDTTKRVASVFSLVSHRQFDSPLDFLTIAPEEAFGKDGVQQIGEFKLGDLVSLTSQKVGILFFISRKNIVHILTAEDEIITATVAEMGSKLSSFQQIALDSCQNPLHVNARIQVLEGSYKGFTGNVQHIRRNTIFVKVKDRLERGGYISVPATWCSLPGGSQGESATPSISQRRGRPFQRGFSSFRGGRGRGFGRRDELIGKQVKIVEERRHKGKIATVRAVDGDVITVLIEATNANVRLKRSSIALLDDMGTPFWAEARSSGSFFGFTSLPSIVDSTEKLSSVSHPYVWAPPAATQDDTRSQVSSEDSVMDLGVGEDVLPVENDEIEEVGVADIPVLPPMESAESVLDISTEVVASSADDVANLPPVPDDFPLPVWCRPGVVVSVIGEGDFSGKMGIIGKCVQYEDVEEKFLCFIYVEDAFIAITVDGITPHSPERVEVDKVLVWLEDRQMFCKGIYMGRAKDLMVVRLENNEIIECDKFSVFHWMELPAGSE
ncbi:KOW motif domain-containing protein [Cardiosporidium cionae]|uniref:KOW motif domain-containing protein n=1 Tax=Cardiosporidium cionae TaxID=476202 RepID=A0ABQ7JAA1_9APIC|nr:KOW motif domain-containing protein [Cardiosporidium cionae]|eukprot:KAF8820933.1 KOW motif domain-containing protein [Cardiosporidium cionae]